MCRFWFVDHTTNSANHRTTRVAETLAKEAFTQPRITPKLYMLIVATDGIPEKLTNKLLLIIIAN